MIPEKHLEKFNDHDERTISVEVSIVSVRITRGFETTSSGKISFFTEIIEFQNNPILDIGIITSTKKDILPKLKGGKEVQLISKPRDLVDECGDREYVMCDLDTIRIYRVYPPFALKFLHQDSIEPQIVNRG